MSKSIKTYLNPKLNKYQIRQIRLGLEENLDVNQYVNDTALVMWQKRMRLKKGQNFDNIIKDGQFNKSQLHVLQNIGMQDEANIDITPVINPRFNEQQMHCLLYGIKAGINIGLFLEHNFNEQQMWTIMERLLDGEDVSLYAKEEYDVEDMVTIHSYLKRGFDCTELVNKGATLEEIEQAYRDSSNVLSQKQELVIARGDKNGIDMRPYASDGFDGFQMEQILLGLENGVDVSSYAIVSVSAIEMERGRLALELGLDGGQFSLAELKLIVSGLENGVDIRDYVLDGYDLGALEEILVALVREK